MATKKKGSTKKSTSKKKCKTRTFKSPQQAKAFRSGVNMGKKTNPAQINPKNKRQVIIC